MDAVDGFPCTSPHPFIFTCLIRWLQKSVYKSNLARQLRLPCECFNKSDHARLKRKLQTPVVSQQGPDNKETWKGGMNALCFLQNGRTSRVKTGDLLKNLKRPFVLNLFYKPKTEKETIMKNLIKITAVSSLLIAACFLISACGGDAENFVQGNGQFDVTVKDSNGAFVSNVKIDVRKSGETAILQTVTTTPATTTTIFQETIGSDYSFTFTDATNPARYATQTITKTPLLTATVNVDAVMQPL